MVEPVETRVDLSHIRSASDKSPILDFDRLNQRMGSHGVSAIFS
jgi:hypothetical protein